PTTARLAARPRSGRTVQPPAAEAGRAPPPPAGLVSRLAAEGVPGRTVTSICTAATARTGSAPAVRCSPWARAGTATWAESLAPAAVRRAPTACPARSTAAAVQAGTTGPTAAAQRTGPAVTAPT